MCREFESRYPLHFVSSLQARHLLILEFFITVVFVVMKRLLKRNQPIVKVELINIITTSKKKKEKTWFTISITKVR